MTVPHLTQHAERQLRHRTGWKRSAASQAAASLFEEGRIEREPRTDGLAAYHYRGLVWLCDGHRIVTVVPGREQAGAQNLEGDVFKGVR